jgi:hypothetical protein
MIFEITIKQMIFFFLKISSLWLFLMRRLGQEISCTWSSGTPCGEVCDIIIVVFLCPRDEGSGGGGILIYPCPSVRSSRYRYMVCPAISSYSFGATALIFCRMCIHIMEVCMSTGFWFSSNILKMTGSWT